MSALPPVAPVVAAGVAHDALRVVLVVDPANPAPAFVTDDPGIDLHLHLAQLDALAVPPPFLRRADVIVVEVALQRPGQLEAFARFVAEQPVPVIGAGRELTVADTRALMRTGALDVLPLPIEPADFAQAIDIARRTLASKPRAAVAKGRVVSFMRAVGGAGATSLACQAGCLWARSQSVCLLDLDIQFGATAIYLDLAPKLGLLDLVEARDRLDTTLFDLIAARHPSGLQLIASPSEMAPLDVLNPAIVTQLLSFVAQRFEVVLVDLPAAWTSWSLAVLAQSDLACLVTSLSVPGLRQARRQLDLIEANEIGAPLKMVLNRVPKKLFRTIDLGDTERVLRRKVDFAIANDWPTMSAAIDQGRTIGAIRPKSPLEKDVMAMVASLAVEFAA